MARLNRRPALLLAACLGLSSLGLAGCGSGAATADARAACKKVERSLALYKRATTPPIPPDAPALEAEAQSVLLSALGEAARATSGDGSFNVLQTTISEASRVPEGLLVDALARQCKVVDSSTPYLAQ